MGLEPLCRLGLVIKKPERVRVRVGVRVTVKVRSSKQKKDKSDCAH